MRMIVACLCLTLAGCLTDGGQYAVYSDHEICLNAGEAGSEPYNQCKAARKEALRQSVRQSAPPAVYRADNGYAPGKSEMEQRRSEMYMATGLRLLELDRRPTLYTLPSGNSAYLNSPMPGDYPSYPPNFRAPQRSYQGAQVPQYPGALTQPGSTFIPGRSK